MSSLTLGLDFGGSSVKIAWLRDGVLLVSGSVPNRGEAADLDRVARRAEELRRAAVTGDDRGPIAVGVAVPGVVDAGRTRLVSAHGKYQHLLGVDLADWSSQRFGANAVVENDARVALLGEVSGGSASGASDAVLLVAGTGIGTAAMMHGRLVRGHSGHAGILGGHLAIDRGGAACNCGNLGCAEVFGGSWSLPERVTMAELFADGADDSAGVRHRLDHGERERLAARVLQAWSMTAVNLVHAYDPEVVVLSGGAVELAGRRVQEVAGYVDEHLWSSVPRPRVVVADQPSLSVVRGLGALAAGPEL
ncbi:MAG TPA: ROK family protein [Microlunatus sp.]|nr:ROK family protein [Microlunatus sp.]